MLENYILWSNATHKICEKIQAHETHKTRETQIYVVHPVWATSTLNNQSFLSIIQQKLKRQNLQQIHCNILCSLSQSPSLFLAPRIHIPCTTAIQYPHKSEGLPSRAKNPNLNITSTVRSSAYERPILTRNYYTFTRKFYICF